MKWRKIILKRVGALDEYQIGEAIRSLRKMSGLSQKDLSEEICTQAQISKIENNNEIPSAIILYKIAKRLGVDMNYFFDVVETPRLDYVNDVKEMIKNLKRERNYKKILEIIKNEKRNPLFQTKENQQFFLWHEAICIHYIENRPETAVDLLHHAFSLTKSHNKKYYLESEIEILNSIAIIQKDIHLYEESEKNFREGLKLLKYIPQVKDKQIEIRLIYGLSKILTDTKRYEESMNHCKIGIKKCRKQETLYLLGELHYQYGSNCARLGKEKKAEEFFEKAIQIFEIQENYLYINLVNKYKKRLLSYKLSGNL